jgi:hypothetical protein
MLNSIYRTNNPIPIVIVGVQHIEQQLAFLLQHTHQINFRQKTHTHTHNTHTQRAISVSNRRPTRPQAREHDRKRVESNRRLVHTTVHFCFCFLKNLRMHTLANLACRTNCRRRDLTSMIDVLSSTTSSSSSTNYFFFFFFFVSLISTSQQTQYKNKTLLHRHCCHRRRRRQPKMQHVVDAWRRRHHRCCCRRRPTLALSIHHRRCCCRRCCCHASSTAVAAASRSPCRAMIAARASASTRAPSAASVAR